MLQDMAIMLLIDVSGRNRLEMHILLSEISGILNFYLFAIEIS